MLKHTETGITFKDRKEAKSVIGQSRYRRMIQNGQIQYIDDDTHDLT